MLAQLSNLRHIDEARVTGPEVVQGHKEHRDSRVAEEPTQRAKRLAEVERLSRKPRQDLHAHLLDSVLGAMDTLTPEDWSALAKKAPDRVLQGLAMSARLAGYTEKSEIELGGSVGLLAKFQEMSDAEQEAHILTGCEERLSRLAAIPALGPAIQALTASERKTALEALAGGRLISLGSFSDAG